jgi:mannose-6-phosphate isomerase
MALQTTGDPLLLDAAVAVLRARPQPLPLTGAVQPYPWGGYDFIPRLMGIDNAERDPFAELWLGAHSVAPARVAWGAGSLPLDEIVARAPQALLGAAAERWPSGFPFLFKVLDVRGMLSIQAHPSRAQAEAGFQREEETGIPLTAAERNYRDRNHKPEAHVALSEFYMLHGFRPLEAIAATLTAVPELRALMPDLDARLPGARDRAARSALLRALYSRTMTMPQEEIDTLLGPLVARLTAEHRAGRLTKTTAEYWAARAAAEHPLPGGHLDRGLVSFFLLNLVRLAPGEGTYQAAGVLHAYLEGQNVEVMASSDNVLRGGLTPKHVAVDELLRTVVFEDGVPEVLRGERRSPSERLYRTPAPEFELSLIDVAQAQPHQGAAPVAADCLLVLEGEGTLQAAGTTSVLARGSALLIPAGLPYVIATRSSAQLVRAGVPRA